MVRSVMVNRGLGSRLWRRRCGRCGFRMLHGFRRGRGFCGFRGRSRFRRRGGGFRRGFRRGRAVGGVLEAYRQIRKPDRRLLHGDAHRVAMHARRLAQQRRDIHVNRLVVERGVLQHEPPVPRGDADEGDRAAFPLAEFLKGFAGVGLEREHVALLRLAAPDFHRRHRGLFVVHLAELEGAARLFDELRAPVGKTARADVVDRENRIVLRTHRHAGVNHLLAAALHFRIAALDGVEIEFRIVRAQHERRGRAAAQPDAHGRTADLDDERADRQVLLENHRAADVAHAARQHDGLVVAPVASARLRFEGAEKAAELRTPEFIAECRAADGSVRHNLQRCRQPRRGVGGLFPGQSVAGDAQIRDHEAADARLRARTHAGGRFIADFAAHAGGRAREGRNGRRVVVRLHLHQDVDLIFVEFVAMRFRVARKSCILEAFDHARVVRIRDQRVVGRDLVRVPDHLEERPLRLLSVHSPRGVENLVAAVLGVDLPEHHDFGVRRVFARLEAGLRQVVNFIRIERQPHFDVGALEGGPAFAEDVVRLAGPGFARRKQVAQIRIDAFGHAVVQEVNRPAEARRRDRSFLREHLHGNRALHTAHQLAEPARAENVRRLRRPRRNGALARGDVERAALTQLSAPHRAQQFAGAHDFRVAQPSGRVEQINPRGRQADGRFQRFGECFFELNMTKFGKGVGAGKGEHEVLRWLVVLNPEKGLCKWLKSLPENRGFFNRMPAPGSPGFRGIFPRTLPSPDVPVAGAVPIRFPASRRCSAAADALTGAAGSAGSVAPGGRGVGQRAVLSVVFVVFVLFPPLFRAASLRWLCSGVPRPRPCR